MARTHLGAGTLLGGRILELLRIRSAQLGECEPCSQSRKHDSITDEDVACLLAPGHGELTPQEQMAVEFIDLLSADHHAMDDEFYKRLGEHFTAAQLVELGFTCAGVMGLHRFIHTLDVYGDSSTRHRLPRGSGRQRQAGVNDAMSGRSFDDANARSIGRCVASSPRRWG